MKIAVGTDHGGYRLKEEMIKWLSAGFNLSSSRKRGSDSRFRGNDKTEGDYQVIDMGTFSPEPCDYPVVGAKVAQAVSSGRADRGLLLCKSGAGMAIVANKFPGVRAAVCQTVASAKHAREHNDANVLVLGASGLSLTASKAILKGWLATPFAGGRHARRVHQIELIEKRLMSSSRKREPALDSIEGSKKGFPLSRE